jgi:hypothetical protein
MTASTRPSCACADLNPREGMEELDTIAAKRHGDQGALEPDGSHIGVGERETDNEEYKRYPEQMDVRDSREGGDGGAGVKRSHLLERAEARERRQMRVAPLMTSGIAC